MRTLAFCSIHILFPAIYYTASTNVYRPKIIWHVYIMTRFLQIPVSQYLSLCLTAAIHPSLSHSQIASEILYTLISRISYVSTLRNSKSSRYTLYNLERKATHLTDLNERRRKKNWKRNTFQNANYFSNGFLIFFLKIEFIFVNI